MRNESYEAARHRIYSDPERFFDHKFHSCGCETVFVLDRWSSQTLSQCEEHRVISSRPPASDEELEAQPAHLFEDLALNLSGDGVVATATCSCGWSSDAYGPSAHNWRAAVQDWGRHFADVPRKR